MSSVKVNIQDIIISVRTRVIQELTRTGVTRYGTRHYVKTERIFEAQNSSNIWIAHSKRHPSHRVVIKAPRNEVLENLAQYFHSQSPKDYEVKISSTLLAYYRHECGAWRQPGNCDFIEPLYGFTSSFEGSSLPAIVVRYFSAGDLPYFLYTKSLSETVKLKLALDIAKALEYLHSQDIKGIRLWRSHIRLDKRTSGELKAVLCNFGSSSLLKRKDNAYADHAVAYLSPESYHICAVTGHFDRDHCRASQSDVWALGCLFCEIFQEDDIWGDVDESRIAEYLEKGEHPPIPEEKVVYPLLQNCARSIKGEYWSLILRCWEFDPEKRLNAKELRACLESMYDNLHG